MAQEPTYDGLSAEGLCQLMQEFGFRAEISATSDGHPVIRSSAGGWRFAIFLYRDDGEAVYSTCTLMAGLSDVRITPIFANRWNMQWRYAKACCDSDSNPTLEYDVFLKGISKSYLRRCFGIWDACLPKYFDAAAHAGG